MRRHALSPVTVLAAMLALAGCDSAPVAPDQELAMGDASAIASQRTRADSDLLKAVRGATSRFNSTAQAVGAGYEPDAHCVAHPDLGAMGYHWVNGPLIDPVFDPLQPEVLLYEAGPGGNMRLTGVEYIVIDVGQPHPEFDGHPFDVGGVPPLMEAGVDHYSLHVWVHKNNPSGLFAPFNPNVSCD